MKIVPDGSMEIICLDWASVPKVGARLAVPLANEVIVLEVKAITSARPPRFVFGPRPTHVVWFKFAEQ